MAVSQHRPFEFAPPVFNESRATSRPQKGSLPLPQPPPFPHFDAKDDKFTSLNAHKHSLLGAPTRPPPFASPSNTPRGMKNPTLERVPIVPAFEDNVGNSLAPHKPMKSALDTPLAVRPPLSQESSDSQSTTTQDGAILELERGIGPSPQKKGHSSIRTSHK